MKLAPGQVYVCERMFYIMLIKQGRSSHDHRSGWFVLVIPRIGSSCYLTFDSDGFVSTYAK